MNSDPREAGEQHDAHAQLVRERLQTAPGWALPGQGPWCESTHSCGAFVSAGRASPPAGRCCRPTARPGSCCAGRPRSCPAHTRRTAPGGCAGGCRPACARRGAGAGCGSAGPPARGTARSQGLSAQQQAAVRRTACNHGVGATLRPAPLAEHVAGHASTGLARPAGWPQVTGSAAPGSCRRP